MVQNRSFHERKWGEMDELRLRTIKTNQNGAGEAVRYGPASVFRQRRMNGNELFWGVLKRRPRDVDPV